MSLSASLNHPRVTFCDTPIAAHNTLAETLAESSTVPIPDLSNCSVLSAPILFTFVSSIDDSTLGGGVDVAKGVR